MKAEDTVIKDVQPFWVNAEIHEVDGEVVCDEQYDLNKLLIAQAEISFKAGIKEVIENLDIDAESDSYVRICNHISSEWWQSKLKEWGIE